MNFCTILGFFSCLLCTESLRLPSVDSDRLQARTQASELVGMAFDNEWIIKPYRPQGLSQKSFAKMSSSNRPPAKHAWTAKYDCTTAPPAGSIFYSQVDEDVEMYNGLFCGKANGTYVEIGALDGRFVSNTKFFDDHMGWSGLLIEATPSNNEKIAENRPNPRNLIYKGGVCPDGQHTMKFAIKPGGNGGTNGDPEQMSPAHAKKWAKHMETITIQCKSLSTLVSEFLQKTGEDHIDFFSLDVEGAELLVLQTFDFKIPIHTFMVEMEDFPSTSTDPGHVDKDEAVRDFLRSHHYKKDDRFPKFGSEVWRLQ